MNSARLIKRSLRFARYGGALAAVALFAGCGLFNFGSNRQSARPLPNARDEASGRLRPGDQIQVRLDVGGQQNQPAQNLDATVDENGEISLPLIGSIKALGMTQSKLAESIEANYVPRYYVRCTATVLVAQRFFYIGGEVRSPSRFLWSEDTTLLKAISTAGGFTDYANRRKVELIRNGKRSVHDCQDMQRNPIKDTPVRPGDTITVPRSIF